MATTGQQAWQDQIAGDPELRGSDHRRPKGLTLPKKRKVSFDCDGVSPTSKHLLTPLHPCPTHSAVGSLRSGAHHPSQCDTGERKARRLPFAMHRSDRQTPSRPSWQLSIRSRPLAQAQGCWSSEQRTRMTPTRRTRRHPQERPSNNTHRYSRPIKVFCLGCNRSLRVARNMARQSIGIQGAAASRPVHSPRQRPATRRRYYIRRRPSRLSPLRLRSPSGHLPPEDQVVTITAQQREGATPVWQSSRAALQLCSSEYPEAVCRRDRECSSALHRPCELANLEESRSIRLTTMITDSMPSYSQIYEETGLAANVTAQLPGSTGGASLGLLVAVRISCHLRARRKY